MEEIDEDGDVQVLFGGYTWTFNPECLSPVLGKADVVEYTEDGPEMKPPVGESNSFYGLLTKSVYLRDETIL